MALIVIVVIGTLYYWNRVNLRSWNAGATKPHGIVQSALFWLFALVGSLGSFIVIAAVVIIPLVLFYLYAFTDIGYFIACDNVGGNHHQCR